MTAVNLYHRKLSISPPQRSSYPFARNKWEDCRHPAKIVGGDGGDVLSGRAAVINNMGEDVTDAYRKGAQEALRLARLVGSRIVLLKEKSPFCGLKTPYCEKLTHSGMGVTAALFHRSGLKSIDINPKGDVPLTGFLKLLREIS